MTASFLHGVETVELTIGPAPIRQVKTALIGLVGTAPMIDVAAADRSLNVIVPITNTRDAVRYFGPPRTGFTIPEALRAIFAQGAGTVYVVNCCDTTNDTTTVANASQAFVLDTLTLPNTQVSNLVIRPTEDGTPYIEDTDYTVDYGAGVVTRIADGAITVGKTVYRSFKYLDPSKTLAADIIGGVDGSGNRTGMQALLDGYTLYGAYPKILIAPGYATQASILTALLSIAEACRGMAIVDAPIGTTVAQAIAGRGPSGAINFYTSHERAILCYPHLKWLDPVTGTATNTPMSQFLAGVMAKTDLDEGYWFSPSNREILGVTGVERALTARINDSTTDVNTLNEVGIVTQFRDYATGIRTWGNRTAAWPSVTAPRNFIPVRRVADVIHESIEYSMLQFLDQPISNALIDAIAESVNSFLRTLIGRGALADGRCWYDPLKNLSTEVALGHLTFDISFMPPPPAERITFESYIDINMLSQLGRT